MEKTNVKNQATTKASNSEVRNRQDVGSSRHPRLPKSRETASPRPDPRRKSYPQKSKDFQDKRPRNKIGNVCEKYRSDVADHDVYNTSKQGSKKTNLNHLLNFTLAPHHGGWDNGRHGPYNRPKNPKYNKELFLQANCQFVVKNTADYTVHLKNPDILVDWSLIEEIHMPCHEIPLCPICLYVPVAAKITRCGHIYCWPCMLHYLSLTDKTWQKCPICFEAVHKTDMKSVSLKMKTCFETGKEITMLLMEREKGSMICTPVTHKKLSSSVCWIGEGGAVTRYQKLLSASVSEIQLIIERERYELKEAYLREKDTPEACFIESALELLKQHEHELNTNHCLKDDLVKEELNAPARKHLISTSSVDSNELSACDGIKINNGTNGNTQTVPIEQESKGISYFYQSEDGQHIFLHNLNVKMLLKEYGSIDLAPRSIKAKVVDIEHVSMTDVLRKRLRYLQHLPLTCEFQLAELDFSSIVSESTLQLFEGEIRKRKAMRNRKARDEKRREKIIEQEINKKMGKFPQATYNLNSAHQFPAYNPEDFLSLSPPKHDNWHRQGTPTCSSDVFAEPMQGFSGSSSSSPDVPFASFAQKLRDGPKTFSTQQPKPAKLSSVTTVELSDNSEDEYGHSLVNRNQRSYGDAIQAALEAMTLRKADDNAGSKKKKKKQLLFTTAMCRNK